MGPVVRGAGEVATQLPSTRADSCLLVQEQCLCGAEASEIKGATKARSAPSVPLARSPCNPSLLYSIILSFVSTGETGKTSSAMGDVGQGAGSQDSRDFPTFRLT